MKYQIIRHSTSGEYLLKTFEDAEQALKYLKQLSFASKYFHTMREIRDDK